MCERDPLPLSRAALTGHSSHTADLDLRAEGDEDLHSVARSTRPNRLAPEQIAVIRELRARGTAIRVIVRELGVKSRDGSKVHAMTLLVGVGPTDREVHWGFLAAVGQDARYCRSASRMT